MRIHTEHGFFRSIAWIDGVAIAFYGKDHWNKCKIYIDRIKKGL